MNTKIDLNNLENENIVNIADRLGVLSEDSGVVFLWFCDTLSALAYMLYYIVKAEIEAKNGDDRLEMMAYYNISEQMSLSEFITYPSNNKAA